MELIESQQTYHFPFTAFHIIVLLVFLQLIVALLTSSLTFTHEESMWHYIGRNWFRYSLTPYSGGVDNKSPLIFGIFGLSDQLFGVNYWFPRILGILCQSIGIYFVYKIARYIAGHNAAILAISLYGLSLLWKSTGGKLVSFTETYAITFIIVSFYKYLIAQKGKDYIISGLLAGVALGFRFSACFAILALLISLLRNNKTSAILFTLGILLSAWFLVALASFAGISFNDFIAYGFLNNYGSGSTTDHSVLWRLESFANGFFYSELILFYPVIIGYFLIPKKFHFLTLWLIFSFIGINVLGIFARPHFKELLPPLSLTGALSLNYLTKNYKIPFKHIMLITWIVFFPKVLEPFIGFKKVISTTLEQTDKYCKDPYLQPDEDAEKKLGLWIKSNTTENVRVFIAGFGARVQLFSERLSPTIYFNVTQTERAKQRLVSDISLKKPELIIVPAFPEYKKYVSEDIRSFIDDLTAKYYFFERCMYGYNIYRIKVYK